MSADTPPPCITMVPVIRTPKGSRTTPVGSNLSGSYAALSHRLKLRSAAFSR